MIGMASGLALSGMQVFVYGIAPFVTMRCFEQVRNDLCYPILPVRIVGVGAGLTYGPAGMTHHSIEDIAVMTCLPNMTVVCPGDPPEVEKAVEASMSLPGPCYLRLGKSGEPLVHATPPSAFTIGKGIRIREGGELALVATGSMLATAVDVCEILTGKGLRPEVVSMHTVKPIDGDLISQLADRCHTIATIEEHSIFGGLGSVVAQVIADRGLGSKMRLKMFGLPDEYVHQAGSQEYLRRQYGLAADQIAGGILDD